MQNWWRLFTMLTGIYQNNSVENLNNRFVNTYTFGKYDINKLVSMLRINVYPYEYMDHGKNSVKHHYLKKEIYYSHSKRV